MARKWYRNALEDDNDPRGPILIGGASYGEVFSFDYDARVDRNGNPVRYDVASLLDSGAIEEVSDPKKEELEAAAARLGIDVQGKTKDDLKAALEAAGEE